MLYYPEMNQKPAPRLFAAHYVRNCYSLTWPASQDQKARETLGKLKIRPLKCCPIRPEKLGEWSDLRQFNEDGFHCLISLNAHTKLFDLDLTATEQLLD
jgi:hypothetical protein